MHEKAAEISPIMGRLTTDNVSATNGTQMDQNLTDFYVGLFLAVSSSIFIGSSFILKKKALIKLAAKDANRRASMGGYGYLKEWMWWTGVITMGVGEACNFAAYAFAPATLVTPLGALSVLVTTVLSSKLLKERLNLLGKIGCAVCILGSCFIVIHSPKEENVNSLEELSYKMRDAAFVVYVAFVILTSLILIFYVAPVYGQTNILVYLAICSIVGSLSVLGCKGFGLAVKETFTISNQFGNELTWFWLFSVVICVTIQLNYLNKSLDAFNTAMVTPIYYVFFTSFVILASGILFNEWVRLSVLDVFGNVTGFLVTIIGIFQMQLFKDVNITLSQLQHLVWRRSDSVRIGETSSFRFDLLANQTDSRETINGEVRGSQSVTYTLGHGRTAGIWNSPYSDSPDEDERVAGDTDTEHVHSPSRSANTIPFYS